MTSIRSILNLFSCLLRSRRSLPKSHREARRMVASLKMNFVKLASRYERLKQTFDTSISFFNSYVVHSFPSSQTRWPHLSGFGFRSSFQTAITNGCYKAKQASLECRFKNDVQVDSTDCISKVFEPSMLETIFSHRALSN
jgi:hypothetical protein